MNVIKRVSSFIERVQKKKSTVFCHWTTSHYRQRVQRIVSLMSTRTKNLNYSFPIFCRWISEITKFSFHPIITLSNGLRVGEERDCATKARAQLQRGAQSNNTKRALRWINFNQYQNESGFHILIRVKSAWCPSLLVASGTGMNVFILFREEKKRIV